MKLKSNQPKTAAEQVVKDSQRHLKSFSWILLSSLF